MNQKAKELNLTNTHFVTPHGLDNDEHYTTAYELAILTDYALSNKVFSKIVNTKSTSININGSTRSIYNTNELLGNLQGVDGVKTGFTNNAGRCLVTSCTRNQNQIITVVLGCDTKKQRTSDSAKLIEYFFYNYTRINLEELVKKEFENWKQINLKRIYINKSIPENIELSLTDVKNKILPIKKIEEKDISISINAVFNYEAPLEKHTKIGNIIIKNKADIIEIVDIICKNTIKRKDIFYYLTNLLSVLPNIKLIN